MKLLHAIAAKMESNWAEFVNSVDIQMCRTLLDHEDSEKSASLHVGSIHPNGFTKHALQDGEFDKPGIRLHVWQPLSDIIYCDPHDHAWDYVSVVLSGQLNMLRYRAESAPASGNWMTHIHHYERFGHSRVVVESRVRLVPLGVERISEGEKYSLERDVVHIAFGGDGVRTVSMCFRQAYQRQFSRVYKHFRVKHDSSE